MRRYHRLGWNRWTRVLDSHPRRVAYSTGGNAHQAIPTNAAATCTVYLAEEVQGLATPVGSNEPDRASLQGTSSGVLRLMVLSPCVDLGPRQTFIFGRLLPGRCGNPFGP